MQKDVPINLRNPLKVLLKHLAYRSGPLEGQCGVRLTAWKDDELYVTRAASLELAEGLFLEIMRPNEGAGHGNRDTDSVPNPGLQLHMKRLRDLRTQKEERNKKRRAKSGEATRRRAIRRAMQKKDDDLRREPERSNALDEQNKALHEKNKRLEQCLENSENKRRTLQRKIS